MGLFMKSNRNNASTGGAAVLAEERGRRGSPAVHGPAPDATSATEGATLSRLKPGQAGVIDGLEGTARDRLRLLEMGLTPGTEVRVIRAAAFGGPLEVLVRGYQLSLRRDEASAVRLAGR